MSMVWCCSQACQALAETLSNMSWPFAPGNGGVGSPGRLSLYLRQLTMRVMGCPVLGVSVMF